MKRAAQRRDPVSPASKAGRLLALRAEPGNPFHVPALTVVDTDAFAAFLAAYPAHRRACRGFFRALGEAVASQRGEAFVRRVTATTTLRADLAAFLRAHPSWLDERLAADVRSSAPLAVRSSGLEDHRAFAQAGAFVSRLNVTAAALPDAVAEVAAAYFEARRYQQLVTAAARLDEADRELLVDALAGYARDPFAHARVIVQAMVVSPASAAPPPGAAPAIPVNVLDQIAAHSEALARGLGAPADTEWAIATSSGVVSIIAFSSDPTLPVETVQIAAAFGAGEVVGAVAGTSQFRRPLASAGGWYVRSDRTMAPIEAASAPALLQVRPIPARTAPWARLDLTEVDRRLIIFAEELCGTSEPRHGRLVVAPNTIDALRRVSEATLDPRVTVAGVVVGQGSGLDHGAVALRAMGLPVLRLDAAALERTAARVAARDVLVASSPPCIVIADAATLASATRRGRGPLDFLVGWERVTPTPAPTGAATADLLETIAWLAAHRADLEERLRRYETAAERDEDLGDPANALRHALAPRVGEEAPWAAVLARAVDPVAAAATAAELRRLIAPTGWSRQLADVIATRLDREDAAAALERRAADIAGDQPALIEHWLRRRGLRDAPDAVLEALRVVDRPWASRLAHICTARQALRDAGLAIDGSAAWTALGWPDATWETSRAFGLGPLIEAAIAADAAPPRLGVTTLALDLVTRAARDVLAGLPLARALAGWLASHRDALPSYERALHVLAFLYRYATPASFVAHLDRWLAAPAAEAAIWDVPDLGATRGEIVDRALTELATGRLEDGARTTLAAAIAQLRWCRSKEPVGIVRALIPNLFDDVIDLLDAIGKALAFALASGDDRAYEPYRAHLAAWIELIHELFGDELRAAERANLAYAAAQVARLGVDPDPDVALRYNDTWKQRLARLAPANLHQVHNNLHQGTLEVRERLAPLHDDGVAGALHVYANGLRFRANPLLKLRPDRLEISIGLTIHKSSAALDHRGWVLQFTEPPSSRHTHAGRIARLVALELLVADLGARAPGWRLSSALSFALGDAAIEIRAEPTTDHLDLAEARGLFESLLAYFEATYQFSGEPIETTTHLAERLSRPSLYRRLIDDAVTYRRSLDYRAYNPDPQANRFTVLVTHLCMSRALFDALDEGGWTTLGGLADASRGYLATHRLRATSNEHGLTCVAAAILHPEAAFAAVVDEAVPPPWAPRIFARHVLGKVDLAARYVALVRAEPSRARRRARTLWDANPAAAVRAWRDAPPGEPDAFQDLSRGLLVAGQLSASAAECQIGYFLPELLRRADDPATGEAYRRRLDLHFAELARRARPLRLDEAVAMQVIAPDAWRAVPSAYTNARAVPWHDVRFAEATPLAVSPPAKDQDAR